MLFNSYQFLIFLPIVFAAYWLSARNLRLQNIIVVTASYIFYGWWDWRFLILIAFTSAWSYITGLIELKRWDEKPSRILLTISLTVNLGILGIFKYYNFFSSQFAELLTNLGLNVNFSSLEIILPVGISFYTFQALSYTIDVYRRQIKPTGDIVAFFAFISFFPQLVAGPIERATNLLPQFLKNRTFDYPLAVLGCRQMLWGFFKKMVVADNCAAVANCLLNDPAQSNGTAIWLGVIMFAFQIYGDFSGYSDIAIGCSKLFGIKLMRNFNFPYFSRDIAEFWRRWHISLTTWFRDYIYIPMGGSRCSKGKRIRNTFVVFMISGLWHGANWTFVFWGAFHAVLFLPLLLREKNRRYIDCVADDRILPSFNEFLRMICTFMLAVIGWAIFRASSATELGHWSSMMFNPSSWFSSAYAVPEKLPAALVAVGLMTIIEWFNRKELFGFSIYPSNAFLRWLCYFVVASLIMLYTPGAQEFIYFQF